MANELTTWLGVDVEPIRDDMPLQNGDRILIRFEWISTYTWLKAFQLGSLDRKLESRNDFRVVGYVDQVDYLVVEVEIIGGDEMQSPDPGSGVTQAGLAAGVVVTVAAISLAITAIVWGLTKKDQYRLIAAGVIPPPKSAIGELSSGVHVLTYVAGGIVALLILREIMRR